MDLNELLAAIADDTIDTDALNAQLAALEPADVDAIGAQIVAQAEELGEGALPPESIDYMEQLADALDIVRAEATRRDTAAAAAAERVAELSQRIHGGTTVEDDGDDEDDDDEASGPTATGGGTGIEDDAHQDSDQGEPIPTGDRALVNASGRRAVNLGAVKAKAPARTRSLPSRQTASLTAAADVPGLPTGARLDQSGLARAAEARFAAFPSGRTNTKTRLQAGIAVITRAFPKDLVQTTSVEDADIMDRAADQSRLPGGSLLAAGGWCAPSETIYDLCEPETVDGLVSIPEFQVRRGGIRYAESPDFADIFSGTGFSQTEAENIAGVEKPCYEVGCPPFSEVRLDAKGVCITAGILQQRGYPEMVQRVINGAMTAHAHKINQYVIERMSALSTAVTATMGGFGAWNDSMAALELHVVDVRYRYRLAETSTLEMVAPAWLKPIFRADLSRRNGSDMVSVSDAQLDGFLRDRNLNVQWVKDWQDAFVTAGNVGFGAATPAADWPTSARVLLYPAGTFTKGVADVIQLDGVYDSTNIKTNNYLALFTEEAVLVARRCMQSRLLTLPTLAINGHTGAQV